MFARSGPAVPTAAEGHVCIRTVRRYRCVVAQCNYWLVFL